MGSVSLGQFATGMAFYLPTLGAALAAAGIVTRRRYGYLPLPARSLAFMVLATAAMVCATVAPAALGILSRPSMLVAALIVLTLALLLPAPAASPAAPEVRAGPRPSSLPSIVIAIVTVGAVTVYELARLRVLLTQPLTDIDMLGFHLPGIARFIQSETLWRIDQFEPGFATAQYPNNGDFLILSAVLPWRSLAFVRLVPVPFYAFTAIGTYALALELRAPRAAAATLAAAIVPVPAMALLALDGLPDVISLATLAAGLVFLIRHARSDRGAELVLAGLALGLSFGTKWYGSTAVAVVLVVWVATRLLTRTAAARVAARGRGARGNGPARRRDLARSQPDRIREPDLPQGRLGARRAAVRPARAATSSTSTATRSPTTSASRTCFAPTSIRASSSASACSAWCCSSGSRSRWSPP